MPQAVRVSIVVLRFRVTEIATGGDLAVSLGITGLRGAREIITTARRPYNLDTNRHTAAVVSTWSVLVTVFLITVVICVAAYLSSGPWV